VAPRPGAPRAAETVQRVVTVALAEVGQPAVDAAEPVDERRGHPHRELAFHAHPSHRSNALHCSAS
jgi:hypothetical protein